MDPEKVEFLPLGFDEFYGKETVVKKENFWQRLLTAVENTCKPMLDRLEKMTEEKKKASEMKIKLLEQELALAEAELDREEAIEDMDGELKCKKIRLLVVIVHVSILNRLITIGFIFYIYFRHELNLVTNFVRLIKSSKINI